MKKLLVIVFAVCLTGTLTSCGDKNERAINKIEKIVDKAAKENDPVKVGELMEEASRISEGINEDELTSEQKTRLQNLSNKALNSISF